MTARMHMSLHYDTYDLIALDVLLFAKICHTHCVPMPIGVKPCMHDIRTLITFFYPQPFVREKAATLCHCHSEAFPYET